MDIGSAAGRAVFGGVVVALLLFGVCSQCLCGGMPQEEKMTSAWPREADGWTWDGQTSEYTPDTLYDHINGAAEVFIAYRVEHASVRRYERPGYPSITAEIYRMGSSEDGFGVFSLDRQDPEAGIGQGSEFGGGMLRFWKDRYFVTVLAEGEGDAVEAAMRGIAHGISSAIKREGPLPVLLAYLPNGPGRLLSHETLFLRSHILLNRRFFVAHQNILRLDPPAAAVLAPYATGKGRAYLLVIRYASEDSCRDALAGFAGAYMPEDKGTGLVRTEDSTWTYAVRSREFLVIVFGAPDSEYAMALSNGARARLEADKR